jgi:SulP family sulfate permease
VIRIQPAARRALAYVRPDPATFRRDALAGVPGAIGSVPDGMASAILVGVNPVYGLYASFAGPVAGGLVASTRLMVITTTSAAALAAGSAVASFSADRRPEALFMLTLLAGVVMVAAGLLRLGRYTRFVSFSVMIGFLTGVAVNIICGQLPQLLGATASGKFAVAKALDVLLHPSRIDRASTVVGLSAIALLVLLSRTPVSSFAAVIALVVPTILAHWFSSVERVHDTGEIPKGVPLPHLPEFALAVNPSVLVGALSVAVLVLVQGVGVAESVPNEGGRASDPNVDFIAQGAGNLASGLFRGQPVGGSVGQTALNRAAGARTRWASIFSGIWMLVILVALGGVVGHVAMPTLAAVLIVAAAGSLRTGAMESILRTGTTSRIAFTTTLLATLLLPVAAAIGIGVALSLLLQLNQEAVDLRVIQLVPVGGGRFAEKALPQVLESRAVTLLDVYGSLFYAGSRTLAARLPEVAGVERPAVVLRLRGRTSLGATGIEVLSTFADRLHEAGGALFLSGLAPELEDQIRRSQRFEGESRIRLFRADDVIGESSTEAYRAAEAWLAGAGPGDRPTVP